MSILDLMAAPFAECLILVAIHTYLGIHVLKRRVIFVDLALAQIAALGTTVGFLFGIMPETSGALIFSMAFTFLGAAVFALTRFRHDTVPQEAVIGLTYAVACAVAVLVVEKTHGAEHLKDILVGNLLWVKWSDVGAAAAAYSLVGVVHFIFRKRFLQISEDPDGAYNAGVSVRLWDFLFYLTFGMVIAFSTRVAGVLLVFVFLVAPAILAFILTNRLLYQLLIGWAAGTVVTTVGLFLSWKIDLPSGPAVISFYAVVLVLSGVAVYIIRAKQKLRAAMFTGVGILGLTLIIFALRGLGTLIGGAAMAESEEAKRVAENLERDRLAAEQRSAEVDDSKKNAHAKRLGPCASLPLIDRWTAVEDPEEKMELLRTEISKDRITGLNLLLVALADDELPFLYREETLELLQSTAHNTFGFDAVEDPAHNLSALKKICDYLRNGSAEVASADTVQQ